MIGPVPRRWAAIWSALCLGWGFVDLTVHRAGWVPGIFFLWLVGNGVLVTLTQWDMWWDNVLLAQVMRRYKRHYEAG